MSAKTYTLSPLEQDIVEKLTKCRQDYDEKIGATPTPYGNRSLWEINLDAYGAEFAFCLLYDTYFSIEANHFCYYDTIINDKTVDIKNSPRPDSWLGVKDINNKEKPDLYSLVIGSFPTYEVKGFISASSIINERHWHSSLGYYKLPHPMYIAYQHELIEEV